MSSFNTKTEEMSNFKDNYLPKCQLLTTNMYIQNRQRTLYNDILEEKISRKIHMSTVIFYCHAML